MCLCECICLVIIVCMLVCVYLCMCVTVCVGVCGQLGELIVSFHRVSSVCTQRSLLGLVANAFPVAHTSSPQAH